MKKELKNGKLVLTTENQKEREYLAKETESDVLKMADLIRGEDFNRSFGKDKRPYFLVTTSVENDFIEPFLEVVRRTTGQSDWTPKKKSYDLLQYHKQEYKGITHDIKTLTLCGGVVEVVGHICSEEWDGMTAEEYAQSNFTKYCNKDFGIEWTPSEYKTSRNGQLTTNKYYARGYRRITAFGNYPREGDIYSWQCYGASCRMDQHWFLNFLFEIWEEESATSSQKVMIDAHRKLHTKHYSSLWHKDLCQGMHVEPTKELEALKLGKPTTWSSNIKDKLYVTSEEFKTN